MAGLFELQLPNESRRRRLKHVSELRLSPTQSNAGGLNTPATEIVGQLVAKQQDAPATLTTPTSIFPWRRKISRGPNSSRQMRDNPPSVSNGEPSQSSDERNYSDRFSSRQPTPTPEALSSSLSLNLIKDRPMPQARAASALAQAGLGLGLPPIAFPGPSSPVSMRAPIIRKTSGRPGNTHGHESDSTLAISPDVGNLRRTKSFSRHEESKKINYSNKVTRNVADKAGDVLVFTRERVSSVVPHSYSMPERPSGDSSSYKGKAREMVSDVDVASLEKTSTLRGRHATKPPSLIAVDRDKSATRRTSWWSGRRRVESSPIEAPPSTHFLPPPPPPPIPKRSQDRPRSSAVSSTPKPSAPSLPTFGPFSPFMGDFQIDSPRSSATSQDRGEKFPRGLDNMLSSIGHEDVAVHHRRHSTTSHPDETQNGAMPTRTRPTSHRYSQSLTTSEQSNLILNALLTSGPSPSDDISISQSPQLSAPPTSTSSRRRSSTINSPPLPSPLPYHETPLLLRQPLGRSNVSNELLDPFLSAWRTNTEVRVSVEVPSDTVVPDRGPADVRRTPSTSSNSTSSYPPSTKTTRSIRARSGTTPQTSRAFATSITSSSLPPAPPSNGLLRRLSSTLFSSVSTPLVTSVESSVTGANSVANTSDPSYFTAYTSSPAASDMSSSGMSKECVSGLDGSQPSIEGGKQKPGKPPTKILGETPDEYLNRLVNAVSKAEAVHVLAASGDEFYTQALRSFIGWFDFTDYPLDVALRKLLMELGLPRETQQIDRVIEAFAARYATSNPGLFVDDDHPYILAFSLIMLHTDAFNKSNKTKMSKSDYVKNTRLPGVPPEILECFFDNIVFAPFVFIEDSAEATTKREHQSEGTSRLNGVSAVLVNNTVVNTSSGTPILGKVNKIDPYYLITQNLLGPLRADVHNLIPKSNPFLYEGTDWPWDTRRLHHLFALAQVVQVHVDTPSISPTYNGINTSSSTSARRKSVVLPSLSVGYGPFLGSPPFSSDGVPSPPRISTSSRGQNGRTLRIAKAGVLARKEDTTEGGKKSTYRKWREWSVILTKSQLLFFRDLNFASHVLGLPPTNGPHDTVPEQGLLYPDEILTLYDCIAVFDITYVKYMHAFRLFMPNGRQFIMQAPDEGSLNDWISAINYASAFKTASVQMRGLGMSHKDAEMTGVAAATSHLHDMRILSTAAGPSAVHSYGSPDTAQNTEPQPTRPRSSSSSPRPGTSRLFRSLNGMASQVDLEASMHSQPGDTEQLIAAFDEVKAELAAHSMEQPQPTRRRPRTASMGALASSEQSSRPRTADATSSKSEYLDYPLSPTSLSRSEVVQSRVDSLDIQINRIQAELDTELCVARNLAILTPFQRATRDRIQMTVTSLAKKVKAMRINLVKLTCYRFVLLTDLAEEERQLEQVKRDALKAATQRISAEESRMRSERDHLTSHARICEEPSTTESFYSALDGSESDQQAKNSTTVSIQSQNDTPKVPIKPGAHPVAIPGNNATQLSRSPSDLESSPVADGHERFYTAVESPEEIAEAWNETRAAKRVSLVRLPSDVALSKTASAAFRRHWTPLSEQQLENPLFRL